MRRRVAFVSGGAKGIGEAIVRKLAACGFSVAVGYNTSASRAESLALELQRGGVNAIATELDVSDPRSIEKAANSAKKYFGFVDTLVCNAGISLVKPFSDCSVEEINRVVAVNLTGTMLLCKAFAGDMTSEGFGRIVNVSSCWGVRGASCEVAYSASKAGVIGFTKSLNAELARSGVLVNAVAPGFINTDMNAHLTAEEVAAFTDGVSLNRVGQPSEVADLVEFLTREKLYVAGETISVDGGLL